MKFYPQNLGQILLSGALAGILMTAGSNRPSAAQSVVISEFMASNTGELLDEDGESSDWIELQNETNADVDLAGWALSDSENDPTRWIFPSVTLPPNGRLLVYASGKDRRQLGNTWDSVVQAQDQWRYQTNTTPPSAWRSTGFDDATWQTGATPIGFGETGLRTTLPLQTQAVFLRRTFTIDDPSAVERALLHIDYDDGYVAYVNGIEVARANCCDAPVAGEPPGLHAVEISGAADKFVAGENVLAIEVHNTSSTSSDLLGVAYLTVMFSKPPASPRGVPPAIGSLGEPKLHTNFSLALEGEYLALRDPSGTVTSSFDPYPPQHPGISYGLSDGIYGYFNTPTPGSPNGTLVQELLQPPSLSMHHGFFDAPFNLLMFPETPGSTIRFTTNGSVPSATNGQTYSGPIVINQTTVVRAVAIKAGAINSEPVTRTYLFLDDVIRQSANGVPPPGWPAQWGSNATDYGMDPQIVNGNEEAVKASLLSIPTFSIVTDRDHLFDPITGIYSNALSFGREWERPTSAELIFPNGEEGFQINAGIRIRGGWSRNDPNPKHAFRLYFRREYGAGKLVYPLFGDEGASEFDNIDLRTSQNYSWAYANDNRNTMVREVWARDTQGAMGMPYTRSRYYHLYINGQYWGVFQTQERAEASYGETYFGGESDEYDVIKSAGLADGYRIEATDGNFDAWRALWEGANELARLPTEAQRTEQYLRLRGLNPDGTRNFSYEVLLDPDNLINYMLVIFFTGNFDAPISAFRGNTETNNFFSVRRRGGDQGFAHFAHDNEHTFLPEDNRYTDRTGPYPAGNNFSYSNPQWLHQQLMASAEYRMRFADLAHAHLFNDGVLTTPRSLERLDARAAQVAPAMLAESARWGDSKRSNPYRVADWEREVDRLRNQIIPPRNAQILNQLRSARRYVDGMPGSGTTSAPLYPSIAAPTFSTHGGTVPADYNLAIAAAAGDIFYTTDGSDPRLIGGGVRTTATQYGGAITLSGTTVVSARARTTQGWSALVRATFRPGTVAPEDASIVISEIHYHPAELSAEEEAAGYSDNEDFEFLELTNRSQQTVDLGGMRFVEGITFTFGSEALEPGGRILIASNVAAFNFRYGPGHRIAGTYQGRLSNGGETLRLVSASGDAIATVDYDDERPWPARADGGGSSLERLEDAPAGYAAEFWRASFSIHGSPGSAGSDVGPGIVINEVYPRALEGEQDAIELYNTTAEAIDISGWYLSDARDYRKLRFADGTVVPGTGYLVVTEDTFNPPNDDTGFSLNDTRAVPLWLLEADANGRLSRFSDEVHIPAARPGESYGRWPNGEGAFHRMQAPTLGAQNAQVVVGPVVIREIMYEPPGNNINLEYVELFNAGSETEDLSRWMIAEAVQFEIPYGISLQPGESLVLVSFDPAEQEKWRTFRDAYWHLQGARLVGPWQGRLDNAGEPIDLFRSMLEPPTDPVRRVTVLEDRVTYGSASPWPEHPAGNGGALRRIDPAAFAGDHANWTSVQITVEAEETPVLPRDAFVVEPPYPNPARERAQIGLRLGTSQQVRVAMYDVLGRRVALLYEGLLDASRQHVLEVGVSHLPSGLYLIRASGAGMDRVATLTVVR